MKDIIKQITPCNGRSPRESYVKKNFPHEYEKIMNMTSFLDISFPDENIKFSLRLYCITNDIYSLPSCIVCDDNVVIGYEGRALKKVCNNCHAAESQQTKQKTQKTNLKKYGAKYATCTDEAKEKVKRTNKERYGSNYAMQSKELKAKFHSSMNEKYGVDWYSQTPEFSEKVIDTSMERYGVSNPSKTDHIKNKIKETHTRKYGNSFIASTEHKIKYWGFKEESISVLENKEKLESLYLYLNRTIIEVAKHLDVSDTTVSRALVEHGIEINRIHSTSVGERELLEFIRDSYNGEVIQADRHILNGKELDIYIPEKKLAVEFNGIYWHSSLYKDKYYHQKKVEECREKGIQLIHIWEDDWNNKKDIIKTIIGFRLGCMNEYISARKGIVRIIDSTVARNFLEKTHIQGKTSASIWYGIYHSGELVSVMGFKHYGNLDWELVRFSSSVRVNGGFSKILSKFKKENEWKTITSFADKDISNGKVYLSNGFTHIYDTQPTMYYVRGDTRVRREKFMKHKLPKIMGDLYDDTLTEHENLTKIRIYRLFTSGLMKFVMER